MFQRSIHWYTSRRDRAAAESPRRIRSIKSSMIESRALIASIQEGGPDGVRIGQLLRAEGAVSLQEHAPDRHHLDPGGAE